MRLESGPAAYDRNYYLAFLALCLALGGYFFYDYAKGYRNKNLEKARETLIPLAQTANVTPGQIEQAIAREQPTLPEFKAALEGAQSLEDITAKVGQPMFQRPDGDKTVYYFVSAYGMGVVTARKGEVLANESGWSTWFKSKDEIQLQLYMGLICMVVALYALRGVYRAATLRAVIDDEGMTYGGVHIPFEKMKRLCDYSPKGWVDLYYEADDGQERRLRIDNQKIRKFDEIIETLCQIKGFEDPRKAAEKA